MHWWTRESSRQLLSLPAAFLGILVPGDVLMKFLAAWDLYAMTYLVLTWFAFRGRTSEESQAIVLIPRRRSMTDRLLVSAPEQFSQAGAVAALVATVVAMPQARLLGAPLPVVLIVCTAAVFTGWLVLQTGFGLSYLRLYSEKGGLDFPGDDEPNTVDFLYFSAAIGTTFGTTDVNVTRSRVRRQVLAHGLLAFLFNTLVLAVAITLLGSYITRP
ncbi:DUF1345 domain-containing protein [Paractinoplanes maris]|uniref:DUF1345 domain-containing protein n=1 Tax=Paractinoplanes maris TaxID=1734446 RepID=UPI0020223248|nr:DUF1345 domain-containing protein [Actinoplanes maris]